MQKEIHDEWRQTKLSGLSRGLRFAGVGLYLGFVIMLIAFIDTEILGSGLAIVVLIAMAFVAVYGFHLILKRGVRWNAKSIQQTGTMMTSHTHKWDDLSDMLPNMHKRATILKFKGFGHVKVYWGFEAHREIIDYAKERIENARTS